MLLLICVVLILNEKLVEGEDRYFLAELEDTESDEGRNELKDPHNVREEAASEKSLEDIGNSFGSTVQVREFNFQERFCEKLFLSFE